MIKVIAVLMYKKSLIISLLLHWIKNINRKWICWRVCIYVWSKLFI